MAEKIGIDEVHAKLLPQDKVTELQKIRQKQGSVMFVGDGINDAPVLAAQMWELRWEAERMQRLKLQTWYL